MNLYLKASLGLFLVTMTVYEAKCRDASPPPMPTPVQPVISFPTPPSVPTPPAPSLPETVIVGPVETKPNG